MTAFTREEEARLLNPASETSQCRVEVENTSLNSLIKSSEVVVGNLDVLRLVDVDRRARIELDKDTQKKDD